MTDIFLMVFNMSLTASYVIVFIVLLRLPLKKAPKVISYSLWIVAAIRLLCPFSFESILSIIPMNTSPISQDIAYKPIPHINSGITAIDTYVKSSLPAPVAEASVNPLQIYTQIGTYIWLLGIAAMLVYSAVSVLILKNRLKSAYNTERNIYEADNLKTPFVLGFFRPRIFIPAGLASEEKGYIIRHEQTHIRRFDHIIKPFAFLVLSIHWFNPLVWLAFVVMGTDMELSCDERVIKEMGSNIKKAYSHSLLSLASGKRIINGSPLAFGEGNVKGRIKNVLNYKKPGVWIIAAAVAACIIASVCLLSNPKSNNDTVNNQRYYEGIPGQTPLESRAAQWSLDKALGADMVSLDYASDDMVIFHGYFGMFVYDVNSRQLIRSLDLTPINCHFTQGDNYCEVSVSTDGSTVQLHPISSENMYVYNISDNTLMKTAYGKTDAYFSSFVPTDKVIVSETAGTHSYQAVKFDTGEYGYLHTSDWTLGSLTYVRGNMVYELFAEKTNIVYTEEDIQEAKDCVRKYFSEEATSRILNELWFDEEACTKTRSSYMQYGRGSSNGVSERNVIVLLCNFTIEKDKALQGYYPNWNIILVRDSAQGAWRVDDQGV